MCMLKQMYRDVPTSSVTFMKRHYFSSTVETQTMLSAAKLIHIQDLDIWNVTQVLNLEFNSFIKAVI